MTETVTGAESGAETEAERRAETEAERVAEMGATVAEFSVVVIAAVQTHDLRRRVLRGDDPAASVEFDGDHQPTTVHLAVQHTDGEHTDGEHTDGEHSDGGHAAEIVAVSTWLHAPFEGDLRAHAVQLRGMATEPARQGAGLGGLLLRSGFEAMRDNGVEVVWARARSQALDFYLAHGFAAVGDEFTDATTGILHRLVYVRLD